MDPIANLGRNAYHALCLAFAAQNKDKLYAPETDALLEEARELLGISEDDDETIRAQIEKDPQVFALRQGQLPSGGARLPGATPAARTSMPPPVTPAAGLGGAGGYDPSPFSAPSHQSSALQKMNSKKKKAEDNVVVVPPPPPPAGGQTSYVGRMLKRLFPDLSPPWVTGTIIMYNPDNGLHLIQYGPPLRKELWDKVEEFAPQNVQWIQATAAPPPAPPPPASKAGGSSKAGSSSKAASKAPTPKASAAPKAPPPPPPVVAAPVVQLPLLTLPGGVSTCIGSGMNPGAVPYNDAWLRSTLPKSKVEDLASMSSAIDARETGLVREVLAMLDDPADVAEITRLLEQSQQLGKREQQLRAELHELGVVA
ncbi:hypothetical protein HXX76_003663 [Chlamydomonas incerta]|uniref:ENT domain-containing protein n=1 Tax=Chlamydomonas incerta TaxID=51695 RepID=A0A835TCN0_CHLIN|nr:hypothetical protein HXX76_003663 [Chlamydomonas incerta]|eukprot:KAG2440808.1 hypothetical protein HXX76_003663 [Chlamydomonas incerta]